MSPRQRQKARVERDDDEEDDDDEAVIEPDSRDFVMARLAAARVAAQAAIENIDNILGHFVDPDDDKDGTERGELFEGALEAVGEATRGIEAAQHVWENDDIEDDGEPEIDLDDEDAEEDDDD